MPDKELIKHFQTEFAKKKKEMIAIRSDEPVKRRQLKCPNVDCQSKELVEGYTKEEGVFFICELCHTIFPYTALKQMGYNL